MGVKKQPMQAPNCCVHEVKAEPSPRDYHFILRGVSQNNGEWTWGIERLAFPFFELKDYESLFVNS